MWCRWYYFIIDKDHFFFFLHNQYIVQSILKKLYGNLQDPPIALSTDLHLRGRVFVYSIHLEGL